ncbi:cysteine desulfurase family protein [soil metagenome]
MEDRLYLDHAATTPVSMAARRAFGEALGQWANPSSPHADGRAARAALEDARRRVAAALDWDGALIFTSGATESIAIALERTKAAKVLTSPIEHDAVLRVTPGAERLALDKRGTVILPDDGHGVLFAIQHVNNETGVIQPLGRITDAVRTAGGILFADCAQSAAKLPLPDADMIAVSAHKFGGPPGIGALLIRDLSRILPSGGQEQGYRAGTENLPAILAMAAALEEQPDWLYEAARLRQRLDTAIVQAGGEVIAASNPRVAAIASYRMPGVSARAQLIQFDAAGISVSAGSACSSGTLRTSHVLLAMGWDAQAAGEVVRVSFGPATGAADIARFEHIWQTIAAKARS